MKSNELTPEQIAKAKEAKAAYMRAWRKRNPEKVKAACQRYWAKKAEEAETVSR